MTLKELKDNVKVQPTSCYGIYKVTIYYRGKKYTCLTTNSDCYDMVKSANIYDDKHKYMWHTLKQAYQRLWDECKDFNGL